MFKWNVVISVLMALTLSVGLVPVPAARAAAKYTIAVGAVKDSNPGGGCTLREAIALANAGKAPGYDITTGCTVKGTAGLPPITYQLDLPAYTYTLTGASGEDGNASGDLDIAANVIMVGQSGGKTILSGGGLDRVLDVDPGGSGSYTVQVGNVIIRNGSANSAGGGVRVAGSDDALYLSNVILYANASTGNGGGIYNGGALTIVSSQVYSNTSSGGAFGGGGIYNDNNGTLRITDSDIYSNTLTGGLIYGGGVYNAGALTISGGSVSGNEARNEGGGGIANGGAANLTGVTVSGNRTPDSNGDDNGHGAGIYSWGAITLTNCTVAHNRANDDGGGVYNAGALTIADSQVMTNTADGSGGGIHSVDDLYISGSAVVSNTAGSHGGGIRLYSTGGRTVAATITATTISRNSAASECGGLLLRARDDSGITLTLANSVISDNRGSYGGGFEVWLSTGGVAEATLTDSDVLSNTAFSDDGGGVEIWASSGSTATVTFERVSIRGNEAASDGGGVKVYAGSGSRSTATFEESAINDNRAGNDGGGIDSSYGVVTLNDSTVSGNTSGADGGGIYSSSAPEPLRLNGCTVSGNTSGDDSYVGGGGVYLYYSSAALINTTISGNAAAATHGGGIGTLSDDAQTIDLTHCTIFSNTSGADGGGMFLESSFTVNLLGSIVAGNSAVGSGPDISGAVESQDYNLIQDTGGATVNGTTTHNITGADPRLDLLADNGGRTETHALRGGSPAIDAIPAASCTLTTDQRGEPRPKDGDLNGTAACDIGAYEFAPARIYLPLVLRN